MNTRSLVPNPDYETAKYEIGFWLHPEAAAHYGWTEENGIYKVPDPVRGNEFDELGQLIPIPKFILA